MVALLNQYTSLLQQGIDVFDKLMVLYTPDKQADKDWADICLSDTRNQLRSFAERLTDLQLQITAEETSSVALSVRQYLDAHWADYREFPIASEIKRAQLEVLHAKLKTIASSIGHIYNLVRKP